MKSSRRSFIKNAALTGVLICSFGCAAYGSEIATDPVSIREAKIKGESFDDGNSAYDKEKKQFKLRKDGDEIVFVSKDIPHDYNEKLKKAESLGFPGMTVTYNNTTINVDYLSSFTVERNGYCMIIKNGRDLIVNSYFLTEGDIDPEIPVFPITLKYNNLFFTINDDIITLEINGSSFVGEQVIFNSTSGTAIVKNGADIEVKQLPFRKQNEH